MSKILLFEAPDGAGKTTIIKSLKERLEYHHKKKVLIVEEIGFSNLGQNCRTDFLNIQDEKTRYLLAMAIRRENIKKINEVKDNYDYILIDRNTPSTLVYQSSIFNNDLDMMYLDIENCISKHLIPDITFYIKRDVNAIFQKMKEDKQVEKIEEVLKYDDKYNSVMAFLRFHNWRIYEIYNNKHLELVIKDIVSYL